MCVVTFGSSNESMKVHCTQCKIDREYASTEQIATYGLKLWWKAVKFLYGITK
jgi:hypothetical protein